MKLNFIYFGILVPTLLGEEATLLMIHVMLMVLPRDTNIVGEPWITVSGSRTDNQTSWTMMGVLETWHWYWPLSSTSTDLYNRKITHSLFIQTLQQRKLNTLQARYEIFALKILCLQIHYFLKKLSQICTWE